MEYFSVCNEVRTFGRRLTVDYSWVGYAGLQLLNLARKTTPGVTLWRLMRMTWHVAQLPVLGRRDDITGNSRMSPALNSQELGK